MLLHALDELCAGLADDDLFAVDEREQGIGRGLGPFDQIAVDVERIAVEPGEFDHDSAFDGRLMVYRRGGETMKRAGRGE